MYTQVLVPFSGTDFSARAIDVAHEIAKTTNAPLRFLTFGATSTLVFEMRKVLDDRLSTLAAAGDVAYSVKAERSLDPVQAIAREVAAEPGSLVCMASVGRSHSAPVLGSVAEGVLRELYGPVILVGPHVNVPAFKLPGRMQICFDGSDTSAAIMSVAAQWVIAEHVEPWLVNVVEPSQSAAATGDGATDVAFVAHHAHELQRTTGVTAQYEVLHDKDAARAITDFARTNGSSLIAMATHGLSGLRRVVLGSTTMKVVHAAPCPVLVMRPPHFKG